MELHDNETSLVVLLRSTENGRHWNRNRPSRGRWRPVSPLVSNTAIVPPAWTLVTPAYVINFAVNCRLVFDQLAPRRLHLKCGRRPLRLHYAARLVAVLSRIGVQPWIMASVRQSKNQSIQLVTIMEPDWVTLSAR